MTKQTKVYALLIIAAVILAGCLHYYLKNRPVTDPNEKASLESLDYQSQTPPKTTTNQPNTQKQTPMNNPSENITSNTNAVTVSFSELMKNPEKYNGKTVKTSGFYASGFERSLLFESASSESSQGASIWIGTTNIQETNKKFDKPNSERGYTADAVIEGVFEYDAKSTFGHVGFAHAQIR
jgi:hypothetical protein